MSPSLEGVAAAAAAAAAVVVVGPELELELELVAAAAPHNALAQSTEMAATRTKRTTARQATMFIMNPINFFCTEKL